jgi:hypothetical protein
MAELDTDHVMGERDTDHVMEEHGREEPVSEEQVAARDTAAVSVSLMHEEMYISERIDAVCITACQAIGEMPRGVDGEQMNVVASKLCSIIVERVPLHGGACQAIAQSVAAAVQGQGQARPPLESLAAGLAAGLRAVRASYDPHLYQNLLFQAHRAALRLTPRVIACRRVKRLRTRPVQRSILRSRRSDYGERRPSQQ